MWSNAEFDFSRRASPRQLPELMDGECSYEEFRGCLRSLEQVNRWLLGYRPTLSWLERLSRGLHKPIHIVDVGSGGGDLLRQIAGWARRRKISVQLTGIDLNPYAAWAAVESTPRELGISWVTGDALLYRPEKPIDIVVSSLMAHHLEDNEIIALLRWMEATAQIGWFINDLERSGRSCRMFDWMAGTVRWHRFVRHDGPVSFRRAFREEDWVRLLAAAEVPRETVTVELWRPGRLCVGRWKRGPKLLLRLKRRTLWYPWSRGARYRVRSTESQMMPISTLLTPSSARSRSKTVIWISLGLTTLFVFITSEVLLITNYPMYHAYRLQVIADRHLLIPHTLAGTFALLIGPINFSSRIRQRHLTLHRVLGRIYVFSVFVGSFTGIALAWGRPGLPGTSMQAAAWMVCTTAAFLTARNRQIVQHRQWMARSYAVTFTFVSSRVLNLVPAYWSHLGDVLSAVGVIAFTLASLLIVELGLNWHELTTRRD